MSSAKRRFSRHERGTVMVMVAFAIVPLIGILALAVDYGNVVVAQTALQNYVDAKVLAHIKESFGLPVPPVQINDYVPFQSGAAEAHTAKGAWNFTTRSFHSFTGVDQPGVPAIQVLNHAINQPLLLGGFFGVADQQLAASATSFVKRRHIVIIQDVSGSMSSGQKMQRSKSALRTFVDFMASQPMPGDSMGLVSFSNGAQVEAGMQLMRSSQVQSLRSRINGLSPSGGTDTEDGLDEARSIFAADTDDLADKIAILLTDGAPNSPSAAESARQALCADPQVRLSTVLISTGSASQPGACNGGREYDNVPASDLDSILFDILSSQRVHLVE